MQKIRTALIMIFALVGALIGFFMYTQVTGNGWSTAIGAISGALVGRFISEIIE